MPGNALFENVAVVETSILRSLSVADVALMRNVGARLDHCVKNYLRNSFFHFDLASEQQASRHLLGDDNALAKALLELVTLHCRSLQSLNVMDGILVAPPWWLVGDLSKCVRDSCALCLCFESESSSVSARSSLLHWTNSFSSSLQCLTLDLEDPPDEVLCEVYNAITANCHELLLLDIGLLHRAPDENLEKAGLTFMKHCLRMPSLRSLHLFIALPDLSEVKMAPQAPLEHTLLENYTFSIHALPYLTNLRALMLDGRNGKIKFEVDRVLLETIARYCEHLEVLFITRTIPSSLDILLEIRADGTLAWLPKLRMMNVQLRTSQTSQYETFRQTCKKLRPFMDLEFSRSSFNMHLDLDNHDHLYGDIIWEIHRRHDC